MVGELQFQHEYLAAKSRVKRWLIVYNQTQPNLYTLMISCQSADFCSFHHFSPGDLYRILKFNQAARNKVVQTLKNKNKVSSRKEALKFSFLDIIVQLGFLLSLQLFYPDLLW